MRICIKCGNPTSDEGFYKDDKTCKECRKKQSQSYRSVGINRNRRGQIYFISGADKIKIGLTVGPSENRLVQIQANSPVALKLLGFVDSDNVYELERELHIKFSSLHAFGEWFYSGVELLEYIKTTAKESDVVYRFPGNNYLGVDIHQSI